MNKTDKKEREMEREKKDECEIETAIENRKECAKRRRTGIIEQNKQKTPTRKSEKGVGARKISVQKDVPSALPLPFAHSPISVNRPPVSFLHPLLLPLPSFLFHPLAPPPISQPVTNQE